MTRKTIAEDSFVQFNPISGPKFVDAQAVDQTTGSFSWAMWAQMQGAPDWFVVKGANTNNAGWRIYTEATGKVRIDLYAGGGSWNPVVTVRGVARVDDNDWHHFAFVVDRENRVASAYIDGELDSSANINASFDATSLSNAEPAALHSPGPTSATTRATRRKNILYYEKALSAAEVASIYAGNAVTDGLASSWPCDEGKNYLNQGQSVRWIIDRVGTNHITLSGRGACLQHSRGTRIHKDTTLLAKILFVTDTHHGQSTATSRKNTLTEIQESVAWGNQNKCDILWHGGDILGGDTGENMATSLGEVNAALAEFDGAGGAHVVLGNHDFDSTGEPQFDNAYWAANCPYLGGAVYYSFDYNGLHYVALNGNTGVNFNVDATQLTWLEADLAAASLPVVIICHQRFDQDYPGSAMDITGNMSPFWTSGPQSVFLANADAVRAVVEASGKVIAVLSGHEHSHHYGKQNGIHYCTCEAVYTGHFARIYNLYSDGTFEALPYGSQRGVSRRAG